MGCVCILVLLLCGEAGETLYKIVSQIFITTRAPIPKKYKTHLVVHSLVANKNAYPLLWTSFFYCILFIIPLAVLLYICSYRCCGLFPGHFSFGCVFYWDGLLRINKWCSVFCFECNTHYGFDDFC